MKNKIHQFAKSIKSSLSNELLIRVIQDSFRPRYYVVYKNKEGKIKTYQIGRIDLYNSFGNKDDTRGNVGFKAYCYGRKDYRSFRHDRIISITKK